MKDVILTDNIYAWADHSLKQYLPHIFCLAGNVSFVLDGKPYIANKNDCIIPSSESSACLITPSEDFRCKVMLLSNDFVRNNAPDSSYRIVGHLGMIQNPILSLLPSEMETCLHNIRLIGERAAIPYHTFYNEILRRSFELFVFDMYDIHARQGDFRPNNAPQAQILIRRFISMLQEGEFRTHRSPSYYAARLCITPVYLTEISQSVTHHSPTYWIDYFTAEEIKKQLADKSLTLSDIAYQFDFSSLSYFSRYCKRVLGRLPSHLRS